ncbi:MAG: PAS domain S-box protein [Pseudomonadota bacterium]|nr:PAS domain S-box protein [Pseudomonadota bacterium]
MPLPNDLFERLVSVVPSPVIVADVQGRVILFNPGAVAVLGYPATEACGHLHVTDIYHHAEDARRVLRRLRARVAEGATGDEQLDVTLRARNGELIPVRLTAALLRDDQGAEMATVGVFEDRREHIALGKRLEDAAVQVEAVERRAAGIAAVSTAVHEMAQPLTAAMGNVEMLLLEPALDAPVLGRLQRTYEQLERLRAIVTRFAKVGRRHTRDLPEGGR